MQMYWVTDFIGTQSITDGSHLSTYAHCWRLRTWYLMHVGGLTYPQEQTHPIDSGGKHP